MPEHIRALCFIALLSAGGWLIASRVLGHAIEGGGLRYVRNMWYAVTFAAFFSLNFWVYTVLVAFLLLVRRPSVNFVVALFVVLLCAVPPAAINVPGLGLVNYLFAINHPRLLSLVVLLPAFIYLVASNRVASIGRMVGDKWLLAYLVLICLLPLRSSTATDALRGAFYAFVGAFLPYYVASRSVKTEMDLRRVAVSVVSIGVVVGLLAIFEALRSWNLYKALVASLGLEWGYNGYLTRDGFQRASGSTGQAIALGYFMALACGACMMVWHLMRPGPWRAAILLILAGGLMATLSRGPWIGALVMGGGMVLSGRNGFRRLLAFLAGAVVLMAVASALPIGQKLINMLPFVGSVDPGSVSYRQQLFNSALVVAARNVWFGSSGYLNSPEMQALVQGDGIVDIVNTYIGVLLDYGVVGLFLFFGFFASILVGVSCVSVRAVSADCVVFRRGLISVMLGLLVIISTVSSISIIPTVYWLMAGLCSAFVTMKHEMVIVERT